MNKQIARQFDKTTLKKIAKGAAIAGSGASAIFLLTVAQGMDFGSVLLNTLAALVVPTLINTIKEYLKGE